MKKTNEQLARELRENYTALRARILDARDVLTKEYRRQFHAKNFDFDNACIWSDDKKLRLQWMIRHYPSIREFSLNQQTSTGTVLVVEEIAQVHWHNRETNSDK
jgi:hypothetical protein